MFVRFRSFSHKHGHISKGALERSLSTNLHEESLRKQTHLRLNFDIVTLDPNKFAERKQQCLHIGNRRVFQLRVLLNQSLNPVLAPELLYDYCGQTTRKTYYPPGLKAFLYYSMSPIKPRIGGELRLRVVSSDDPASFERGSDLMLSNGRPWIRPLYSISKYYLPLYEKLKEDQFIPDDLDAVLSTFPSRRIQYRRSHLLYTFNDTFIVDFSNVKSIFYVITEQGMEKLVLNEQFSETRKMWNDKRPYTGSALARFERSTLPEHEGTRTVVLRFLKMITPVECVLPYYDGHICLPKEGELHRRTNKYVPDSDVWSVDIDEQKRRNALVRGFQLLWDT